MLALVNYHIYIFIVVLCYRSSFYLSLNYIFFIMKIISNRFSFATIGIISGHPRFDKYTARIIDVLKEQSKEPLEFVGVIGDAYSNKLSQTYASSSVLAHE